jgi:hypothetical protein
MVEHICNPSTWEDDLGGSSVKVKTRLHREESLSRHLDNIKNKGAGNQVLPWYQIYLGIYSRYTPWTKEKMLVCDQKKITQKHHV